MRKSRLFSATCACFIALGLFSAAANATTIQITAVLDKAPIQDDFPSVFPVGQTITGSFTFADPAPTAPPYNVGSAAVVGEDELGGTNQALFRGIGTFSLNIPGYGTGVVTGSAAQVFAFNPFGAGGTETFRIAAGGTINDPNFFGGTVTGATVPLGSGGNATLVGAYLEVQSNQNVLSGQNVTDAADALINNLAGWNVRTDKQIRLSFSNPNAPSQTLEVDYTLTSVVVPIPAAVWLFGSGLLGLVGIARRRPA